MEELFTERFDSCYDCLTSAANLRAICTVFSPLEGLDLSGESNNACRDILDSFLRMLRGLGCSPSEAAADSASLAIFTISVCSKICSCEVKDEFGSNTKFCFFLRFYGTRGSQGPQTRKKRTRPISSHLNQTSLVNQRFTIWHSGKCFLRVVTSRQDSAILPARVANHSAGFSSSFPLTGTTQRNVPYNVGRLFKKPICKQLYQVCKLPFFLNLRLPKTTFIRTLPGETVIDFL